MLSIPADAAASTRQPLEVSVLILSQWNLAQTVHKPGWLVSQGSDQLYQQFSSALASIAGQEVIWGPFIKHGLFCKMRFSDLEPVVMLTNDVIVYSTVQDLARLNTKMMNFNRYSPLGGIHGLYLTLGRPWGAVWVMLYGHFASQSVIMNEPRRGVLRHSLRITPVTVFDLLYPCSSALSKVAPNPSLHQRYRRHSILFVSTFCGAGSLAT